MRCDSLVLLTRQELPPIYSPLAHIETSPKAWDLVQHHANAVPMLRSAVPGQQLDSSYYILPFIDCMQQQRATAYLKGEL